MKKNSKYEKMLWDTKEIDKFLDNKNGTNEDVLDYFVTKVVLDKISKKANEIYFDYIEQVKGSCYEVFANATKNEQKETAELLQEIEHNLYKSIAEKHKYIKPSSKKIEKVKQNFNAAYEFYHDRIEFCGLKPFADSVKKEQKLYNNCFYYLKKVDNKYCKDVNTLEKVK